MTRKEFEEKSFDEVMEQLNEERDDITTYESLKEFAIQQIEEDRFFLAIHILESLDKDMEDKLSDLVVDMNLKYDKVFSVIDIDYETFRKWEGVTPFYQNVTKEGIVLWKAA